MPVNPTLYPHALSPRVPPLSLALIGRAGVSDRRFGWILPAQALHALGVKLLRLVALSLDLAADFFDADFTRPMEM